MENAPSRLTETPSWLITQLAVHARRLVFDGLANAGARSYHYRLLAALTELGPGSQASLGRQCVMDRSDVVATVNELVDLGCVERATDPADRRRNIVTITEQGTELLRRLDVVLGGLQDQLMAPLSDTERRELVSLLSRLLAHHATE